MADVSINLRASNTASGPVGEATKSVEDLSKAGKSAGQQYQSFKQEFTAIAGGIAAAGAVIKAALDLTEEGAQLKDTQASLERLADTVGYAGDLSEDLGKAFGGTVDDADYMASAIRLLTGETGALGKRLAEASPQLATITRALFKLNPTLGDSASIFEALTRAIETGQTRSLKPYGIIIEDTSSKQAILNQILAQGATIIEQVGGNVETSSDSLNRFKMLIDDAKDAVTLFLADGLLPIAEGFLSLGDAINTQKQAAVEGNLTFDEYADTMGKMEPIVRFMNAVFFGSAEANLAAAQAAAVQKDELARLNNIVTSANDDTLTYADSVEFLNSTLTAAADETASMMDATGGLTDSVYEAYVNSEKFADRLVLVNEKAALMIEAMQNAKAPVDELMDRLDQDIQSPLEDFINDLQFFTASGGQDFVTAFEQIKQALANGDITASEAQSYTAELLAQIQNVKIKMGELTFDEAAANLSSTLNVSLAEAKTLLESVSDEVRFIEGEHNVHFNISQTGNIPALPSGPPGQGAGAVGFAGGTSDFIVPPGYPNDSFMVGLTSGEKVNVTTPDGHGGSGFSIGELHIHSNATDPQAVAQAVGVEIGRQLRLAQTSGASRYGR